MTPKFSSLIDMTNVLSSCLWVGKLGASGSGAHRAAALLEHGRTHFQDHLGSCWPETSVLCHVGTWQSHSQHGTLLPAERPSKQERSRKKSQPFCNLTLEVMAPPLPPYSYSLEATQQVQPTLKGWGLPKVLNTRRSLAAISLHTSVHFLPV